MDRDKDRKTKPETNREKDNLYTLVVASVIFLLASLPHRPELEDERQKLVVTMSSYQRALQATEERILHTLSSVQGNILESEEAIDILQQTKVRERGW